MNILIITDTYPPIIRSAGRIMKDLADEFFKNGHSVTVITLIENNKEHNELNTDIYYENGVRILRIKTFKLRNVGFIRRGLSEEIMPYLINIVSLSYFKSERFDLIIAYSPPINLYKVISKYKKLSGCKSYLVLRDIHPQTGKDLGIIKNPFIFNFYRRKEKKLYQISDYIAVQSPANKVFLLDNNDLDESKVDVLYNWKNTQIELSEPTTNYRQKLGLDEKVICLYGGNMSITQDINELIEIATALQDRKNVCFLVIGFGAKKEQLICRANELQLKNTIFHDALPCEEYDLLVKQCDIGLIHLNKKFKTQNIPGRLLDYLFAGIPVIASVNQGNDIGQIIESADCGYVCESDSISDFQKCLEHLIDNAQDRKRMGKNGKIYLEKNLSSKYAYNKIMDTIK
ncbi:MAG TPA: glycosyltransferase family 4 protein [Ruminiclostridium sp.]